MRKNSSSTLRFSCFIKSGIAVGLIGGIVNAWLDITISASRNEIFFSSVENYISFIIKPIIWHVLFELAYMGLVCLIIYYPTKQVYRNLSTRTITVFFIFFYIMTGPVMILATLYDLPSSFTSTFYVLIALALVSFTISFFIYYTYKFLSKTGFYLASTVLLTVFLFSLTWPNLQFSDGSFSSSNLTTSRQEQPASTELPNVVLIVIDALRADHVSAYGYERQTTPNIDRLAAEGIKFTEAVADAPWTLPSHASLFTGLPVSAHGVDSTWTRLNGNLDTLAETLSEIGYYTIGISNNFWVSASNNFTQGFREYFTFRRNGNSNHKKEFVLPKLVETLTFRLGLDNLAHVVERDFMALDDNGAAETNIIAGDFFNRVASESSPFFLFINYMEVHTPYGVTESADRYLDDLGVSKADAYTRRDAVFMQTDEQYLKETTVNENDQKIMAALYDGDLFYMDKKVGELADFLRELELLDDTIFIITSDHGENLGEHGVLVHKFDIHRTLTHIPLIIRYPENFAPGSIDSNPVQLSDIFSTIMQIINVREFPEPGQYSQPSLLTTDPSRVVYSQANWKLDFINEAHFVSKMAESSSRDPRYLGGVWKSIYRKGISYIETPLDTYLYDIKKDPREQYDLNSDNPEMTEKMRSLMRQYISTLPQYWGTLY